MEKGCHGDGVSWRWGVMEMGCHGDGVSWRWGVMEMGCHGEGVSWRWGVMEMGCHGEGVSWRWGVMEKGCHGDGVSWRSGWEKAEILTLASRSYSSNNFIWSHNFPTRPSPHTSSLPHPHHTNNILLSVQT